MINLIVRYLSYIGDCSTQLELCPIHPPYYRTFCPTHEKSRFRNVRLQLRNFFFFLPIWGIEKFGKPSPVSCEILNPPQNAIPN